jgi:hypothetical protein
MVAGGGENAAHQTEEGAHGQSVRRQNIPSKNVAKSGAFTKAKTSWSKSMMLLKRAAK